jgi:predicted dehydrogenase
MKLGLVGVGKWSRILAAAFQAEGAEIAGHYRISNAEVEGFGPRFHSFDEMIELADAVVLAAPPDVTLTYALACAAKGVPVLATKPLLLDAPIKLKAPFYVDYWRLWDPFFLMIKRVAVPEGIEGIVIHFYGNGPFRSFPGLDDYGPHALAFARTLVEGELAIEWAHTVSTPRGELFEVKGRIGETKIGLTIGNGSSASRRRLQVFCKHSGTRQEFDESPASISYAHNGHRIAGDKEGCLAPMVRAFMQDVRDKRADPKTMLLSVQIACDLRKIRQAVG